jgi:signal transduction histidine kinase
MEINRNLAASSERMRAAREVQQRRMRAEVAEVVLPSVEAAAEACRAEDGRRGREQAQVALDRLRRISRGIYPPRLAEDGVAASVHGWLEMMRRRTALTAVEALDDLDPDLAAGVYFIAVTLIEALDATEVSMRRADAVELVVRGQGAADSDLITLAQDRAEAFGGQLELVPPASVTCRVPAGSP